MTDAIDELSHAQAIKAVQLVAARWSDKDGLTAQVSVQAAHKRAASRKTDIAAFAVGSPKATAANGKIARNVLKAIAASGDRRAREWVRGAVADAKANTGQALDPVSLALGGALLIALILAARLKRVKVGDTEIDFYEGVPKEVVDVVKAGAEAAKLTE